MRHRLVILGAGTGGTSAANRLRRVCDALWRFNCGRLLVNNDRRADQVPRRAGGVLLPGREFYGHAAGAQLIFT
jgi:putative redox protein